MAVEAKNIVDVEETKNLTLEQVLQRDLSQKADILVQEKGQEIFDNIKKELEDKIGGNLDNLIDESINNVITEKRVVMTEEGIELTHKLFPLILDIISNGQNIMLWGEAGAGKNYLVEQVAKTLKTPFNFTNAVLDTYQLKGFIDANGKYVTTSFYEAWNTGGVFMLDELDASDPEVLIWLNSALANGYAEFPNHTEPVRMNENFVFVAGANTNGYEANGKYKRQLLDGATLDRFAMIEFKYDANLEKAIVISKTSDRKVVGVRLQNNILRMVATLWEIRRIVDEMDLPIIVSTRTIANIVKNKTLSKDLKEEELLDMFLWKGRIVERDKVMKDLKQENVEAGFNMLKNIDVPIEEIAIEGEIVMTALHKSLAAGKIIKNYKARDTESDKRFRVANGGEIYSTDKLQHYNSSNTGLYYIDSDGEVFRDTNSEYQNVSLKKLIQVLKDSYSNNNRIALMLDSQNRWQALMIKSDQYDLEKMKGIEIPSLGELNKSLNNSSEEEAKKWYKEQKQVAVPTT